MQSVTSSWQVGQLVQASVVRQTGLQSVVLQIGTQQMPATTTAPLTAGQQITAIVTMLGDRAVLQVQSPSLPPGQPLPQSSPTGPLPLPGTTPAATTTTTGSSIPLPLSVTGTHIEIQIPLASAPGKPTTTPSPLASPLETALKQLMPKQASMSGLLANLGWLNSADSAAKTLVPPAVTVIAKELLSALPDKNRIAAPGALKQGIQNSGIFFENKLSKLPASPTPKPLLKQLLSDAGRMAGRQPAAGPEAKGGATTEKLGGDLKLMLLRMLGTIQQVSKISAPQARPGQPLNMPQTNLPPLPNIAPPLPRSQPQPQKSVPPTLAAMSTVLGLLQELGKQTEASLARTQLHQLASTQSSDSGPQTLALELPIRNNERVDIFDLVIEQEASRDEDEEVRHRWSIILAFDLENLGPVYAKLQLVDDKVSTTFWADSPETTRLFNDHLNNLASRYREAGVAVADIRCFQGAPPEAANPNARQRVLDVKV